MKSCGARGGGAPIALLQLRLAESLPEAPESPRTAARGPKEAPGPADFAPLGRKADECLETEVEMLIDADGDANPPSQEAVLPGQPQNCPRLVVSGPSGPPRPSRSLQEASGFRRLSVGPRRPEEAPGVQAFGRPSGGLRMLQEAT